MVTITPITLCDHESWLELWNGYLEFYEANLDQETTATTFARLVDPASGINGALARDDDGAAVGFVHWLTAESNTTARSLYDRVATRSGMIHYQIPLES